MKGQQSHWKRAVRWVLFPFALPIALAFSLLVALMIPAYYAWRTATLIVVWILWSPRGINTFVLYSDSPYWKDYFEREFIPSMAASCRGLNRSQKSPGFRVQEFVFYHFVGDSKCCPVVIIFQPLRWHREFHLFEAFRDLKHGKPAKLQHEIEEMSEVLSRQIPFPSMPPVKPA